MALLYLVPIRRLVWRIGPPLVGIPSPPYFGLSAGIELKLMLSCFRVTSVDRNPQNSSTSSVKGSPQRTGGIVRDDPLGSSRSANNTTKVHSNCEAIEMGTFGDDSEKSDVHQIQITRTVDTDDKCDRVSSTGSQEHIIKDYEERRHF